MHPKILQIILGRYSAQLALFVSNPLKKSGLLKIQKYFFRYDEKVEHFEVALLLEEYAYRMLIVAKRR